MTQNEIYHFGIPGMKWGRRKGGTAKRSHNIKDAPHKNYDPALRDSDRVRYGKNMVKYTNRFLHDGADITRARQNGLMMSKYIKRLKLAGVGTALYVGQDLAKASGLIKSKRR